MPYICYTAATNHRIHRIEIMQLDWYSVILIIGLVQGAFFSLALWTKQSGNRQANRFLAAFALTFAVILLDELLEWVGAFGRIPHALGLIWPAVFLVGPLFWWYVQSMIDDGIPFAWPGQPQPGQHQLRHLIPGALSAIVLLPVFLLDGNAKRALLTTTELETAYLPQILVIGVVLLAMFCHTGYYVLKSMAHVRAYNRSLPDAFSYDEDVNLRWLNYLSAAFLVVWVLFLFDEILGGTAGNILKALVDFGMVLVLFIIGLSATRQTAAVVTDQAKKKYESSTLSAEQATYTQQRLLTLMETEKPYLQGKLTLPQLAKQLNITPNNLSQIINERLERNFFDFVNQYRIEEAKKLLLADEQRTVLDIALAAGFNSKSGFYKVFKQQIGLTPSAFRKAAASSSTSHLSESA